MSKLPQEKYIGDTVSIARDLLGRYLVRMWQGQPLVCRIVETEAYVGADGQGRPRLRLPPGPQRNAAMFGPAGPCVRLPDLRDAPLPELCHRAGGRALRRAAAWVWSRCVGTDADERSCGTERPLDAAEHLPAEEFSRTGRANAAGLWRLDRAQENGLDLTGDGRSFSATSPEDIGAPPGDAAGRVCPCIPASASASTTLRKP